MKSMKISKLFYVALLNVVSFLVAKIPNALIAIDRDPGLVTQVAGTITCCGEITVP